MRANNLKMRTWAIWNHFDANLDTLDLINVYVTVNPWYKYASTLFTLSEFALKNSNEENVVNSGRFVSTENS